MWVFYLEKCLGDAEQLYKKDLHDPDNHDGVITHLDTWVWILGWNSSSASW